MLLNGLAALRRPLSALIEFDPIGKRMVEKRGEKFALRVYRIFGASQVLLGLASMYVSLRLLRGG